MEEETNKEEKEAKEGFAVVVVEVAINMMMNGQ